MQDRLFLYLLFHADRACGGVETDDSRCEELLYVAAADHLLGGEDVQLRGRDEGNGVA